MALFTVAPRSRRSSTLLRPSACELTRLKICSTTSFHLGSCKRLREHVVWSGAVRADVYLLHALVLRGSSSEFGMLGVECAQVGFVPLRSSASVGDLESGLESGHECDLGEPFKIGCKDFATALLSCVLSCASAGFP
mmetsp:Transcript_41929/g.118601  ORF Transcript_41929/g.118601 Transcript_41929/m.118601 type:complete len:137 (+) Transcript_41929:281-691(+)